MRIAILGGAFDPVHKGHIQIARKALTLIGVDEVWFMPAKTSPWKKAHTASFDQRAHMISLAIRGYSHMKVCTLEAELDPCSYTIHTVQELQHRYPQHEFCWLIGDDQARQFTKWKNYEELLERIHFYVFSREEIEYELIDGLTRVPMPLIDVSSSEIREGKKLYQLPKAVFHYMAKTGIYLEGMIAAHMNEHRFQHSLSVAKLCVELAQSHHLDTHVAYLMGISHDICKQLPYEQAKIWMKHHLPQYLEEAPAIWHGYIGADYVSRVLGIQDRRVSEAIYHHVKGRNKTDYDRILFIADKLDPSRGYDSSKEIECSKKNLKEGYALVKQQQEAYLKKEGTI